MSDLYTTPAWVHQLQPSGDIDLLGQRLRVTLAEAEEIGERLAILMIDGGLSEVRAQRVCYRQLLQRRRIED